jgi:hypothetical protein
VNQKPRNPLEEQFRAWARQLGLYVGLVLVTLGLVGVWVFVAWNLALPPLGVPAISYPQACGFTLFLALFVGLGLVLKETAEK